jgi:hypothetical protein
MGFISNLEQPRATSTSQQLNLHQVCCVVPSLAATREQIR